MTYDGGSNGFSVTVSDVINPSPSDAGQWTIRISFGLTDYPTVTCYYESFAMTVYYLEG